MSHSTLLVIVENAASEDEALAIAEDRLADYDENKQVDPYLEGEVPEDDFAWAIWGAPEKQPAAEEIATRRAKVNNDDLEKLNDYYGSGVAIEDGKYIHYSTYNPKSKWDWYQLGGRWDGMLPSISKVQGVNILQKKDIDFIGSQQKALREAEEVYDRYEKLAGHLDPGPSFDELVEKYSHLGENEKYARAREEYNSTEWIQAVREPFGLFLISPHEYFYVGNGGRKAFIDGVSRNYLSTFAVLDDNNEWHERGRMGMFATVANEMEAPKWESIFWDKVAEASPDAWLMVFDLHI